MRKSSKRLELPSVFTDRSLGDYQVPEGLRAAGFAVHTMAEVYGQAEAQSLDDPDWIRDMTECGLVLLSKDAKIRSEHVGEVIDCRGRVFLLPEQRTKAEDQIARYVDFKHKVAHRARKPGPLIYMMGPKGPEKWSLPN